MESVWQLQEAKNKFSQIVEEAVKYGPQVIVKDGAEIIVVLSYAQYRKLVLSQKKLSEFFRDSPLVEADLDLSRDKSEIR